MSYSKESKRDREAREERLGGVFFIGRKENGEIDWPEDWTDFEIERFLRAEQEAASKLPDI